MKVINNTNEIKHLPYGGVLEPGEGELSEVAYKANKGHPGFDDDIEKGRLVFPELKEDEKTIPEKIIEMTVNEARPVIRQVENKTVLQGIVNLEKDNEDRDSIYNAVEDRLSKLGE